MTAPLFGLAVLFAIIFCIILRILGDAEAFGAGDYNAAQKCANERGVVVEDAPSDEDTEKFVVNA